MVEYNFSKFQPECESQMQFLWRYRRQFPPHCQPTVEKKTCVIARSERDGTCAETRFGLSAKRWSPFKSAGGGRHFRRLLRSRGVRISGSNAGYTVFRGSVKGTGYPLHSAVVMLDTPCSEVQCNTTGYPLHSAVVMLDTPCSEVVWRVLATHCIER